RQRAQNRLVASNSLKVSLTDTSVVARRAILKSATGRATALGALDSTPRTWQGWTDHAPRAARDLARHRVLHGDALPAPGAGNHPAADRHEWHHAAVGAPHPIWASARGPSARAGTRYAGRSGRSSLRPPPLPPLRVVNSHAINPTVRMTRIQPA